MDKIQTVSVLDKDNNFICYGIIFAGNNVIAPAHVNRIVEWGVTINNQWTKLYPVHVDIKHLVYFIFKKAKFESPKVYTVNSFHVQCNSQPIELYPYKVQLASGKIGYHVKTDANIFLSGMPVFNSHKQFVGVYIWKSPYLAVIYTDFNIPEKPTLAIPEGTILPKLISLNNGALVFQDMSTNVKKLVYRSEYPAEYIQLPTTCNLVKFTPQLGLVQLNWIDKRPVETIHCTEFTFWFYFLGKSTLQPEPIKEPYQDLDEKIISSIQKCPPLTVL